MPSRKQSNRRENIRKLEEQSKTQFESNIIILDKQNREKKEEEKIRGQMVPLKILRKTPQ